ncbi:MAG: hypothetical protein ACXW3D_06005 [Caulobacteraceae bacterium]
MNNRPQYASASEQFEHLNRLPAHSTLLERLNRLFGLGPQRRKDSSTAH